MSWASADALDPFLLRAGLAGIGLALAAGPIGCFVIWRRMAYFGDATAHAALLGVALGLALEVPLMAAVLVAALAMAVWVSAASAGGRLSSDTALGVAAHGGLAAGLVAIALVPAQGIGLESFLFGDILAVTWADVATIWAGSAAILGLVAWRWRGLLTTTLNADLGAAEGWNPAIERLVLMAVLAGLVAVAFKVVGALLVTAMLIIPAAAARSAARTPEAMAVAAAVIGVMSVLLGLGTSLEADLPAGPAIVVAATALFALSRLTVPRP